MQSKTTSLWSTFKNSYIKKYDLKKFYLSLDKKKISKNLNDTLKYFIFNSQSYNWGSKFWRRLIINHLNSIINNNSNKSAQEISKEYFTFTYFNESLIKGIVELINKSNFNLRNNIFKKQKYLSNVDSINHNIIIHLLYEILRSRPIFKKFIKKYKTKKNHLNKPSLLLDGVNLSQDDLNSLLEYEKIKQVLNSVKVKKNIVLEIGSGSGRTAQMFLLLDNKAKYVIADIPPALNISYTNTKKLFPKKKIGFAYKKNGKDLIREIYNNDVTYIFPHQIEMVPDKIFDISIAIDCLHEMEEKIVKKYMFNFERISQSIYFKVWETAGLPNSFYKKYSVHNENDYFLKKKWIKIFKERCIFPSDYYQFGFKF